MPPDNEAVSYLRRDVERLENRFNSLEQRLDAIYARRESVDVFVTSIREDVAEIKGRSIWLFRAIVVAVLGVAGNLLVVLLLGAR